MEISDYSEKSFVVRGNTKEYKDKLKEFGGKWNSNLTNGGGWIFSKKHKDKIETFVSQTVDDYIFESADEEPVSKDIFLHSYSDKSFVVRGDTKPYKDKIKELGGKWNSNLTDGGGWIFPNTKKDKVNEWIATLKS